MIQKKNKEILILPLKAPLQPKKRFAVGLFSNSRKSLFFPSKQIIMKEIAIMTGAKKYERIIERKQKERKAMERKTAWNEYKKKDMKKLEKLNAGYRAFLDHGKTERECVKESVRQAEEAGYVSLDTYVKENRALKPGDKVYAVCMKKAIALFQIGTKPLTEGMNILGAHIDSPRLDVKQNPLYEDNGFTYLDTHYYGGIKKWQWVTLPLAIHGVVAKKDGEVVDVVIGEDDNDPVFCVTDLLIHLSREQQTKPASTVVEGENLDLLIGSQPLEGTEKEALSYALYPKVFEDYLKSLDKEGDFRLMGSDIFFHGLSEGETCEVKIAEGKELVVRLSDVRDADDEGFRNLVFEVNGNRSAVKIKDQAATIAATASQIVYADAEDPSEIGANIPGLSLIHI